MSQSQELKEDGYTC